MVKRVPEGAGTVSPWIVTRDTAGFLDFVKAAFGAQVRARIPGPGGSIAHAEAQIGDSVVLAFDSEADWPATPALLRLIVEDADATYHRALQAGARPVTELADTFFGDRAGRVADPFGNVWWIQAHTRDVEPAEVEGGVAAWATDDVERGRHTERTLDTEMRARAVAAFRAGAARPSRPSGDDIRLELVIVPVTDVDRAKAFYVDRLGFHADYDVTVNPSLRFVQLTAPGSACSIAIGLGLTQATPGSQQGLQAVIADARAMRERLLGRGVEVGEVDVQDWGSFLYVHDPDGNAWALQQLPTR